MRSKLAIPCCLILGLAASAVGAQPLPTKVPRVSLMMMAANPGLKLCGATPRCKVEVSATPDGTSCNLKLEFLVIAVAATKQPRIVWQIVNDDPNDLSEYQFVDAIGVELDSNNDPREDLDGGGFEDPHLRRFFKWEALNHRVRAVSYALHGQRKAPGSATWVDCHPVDPVIVNLGRQ
jgi:hypothetical protein